MKPPILVKQKENSNKEKNVELGLPSQTEVLTRRADSSFDHLRYVVILAAGLAVGLMLFARMALTTALVSMVNHTALYELEHPNSSAEDYFPEDYVEVGEFLWTNEVQQLVISAYMVVYALPQFLTSRLAFNKGLRISVPFSLSICALSLLLTPLVAHWGWQWVLLLRLANALGASPILPMMILAVEKWMPPENKVNGFAIGQFACNLIFATVPLTSGYLASMHWSYSFYVPAAIILAFCVIWYLIISDSPELSKLISRNELKKIKESETLAETKNPATQSSSSKTTGSANEYPWYFMFKIPKFYPLVVVWALQCSSNNVFMFLMPAFFKRILELPVDQIGYLHFISQLGLLVCMLWSGPATKWLQKRFNLSLSVARKTIVLLCRYTTFKLEPLIIHLSLATLTSSQSELRRHSFGSNFLLFRYISQPSDSCNCHEQVLSHVTGNYLRCYRVGSIRPFRCKQPRLQYGQHNG